MGMKRGFILLLAVFILAGCSDNVEKVESNEVTIEEAKKEEQKKYDEEQRKKQEEAERLKQLEEDLPNILRFVSMHNIKIDSAGGAVVKIYFNNSSKKTIKYISFNVTPYNAVGDVQRDSISGESTRWLKKTGPIEPMEKGYVEGGGWKGVWYNNSVTSATIDGILIEYMDGSKVEIPKELTGKINTDSSE